MQVNSLQNNNSKSFGIKLQPTAMFLTEQVGWSTRTKKLYDSFVKHAETINPDKPAKIAMSPSTNLSGTKKCLVNIVMPYHTGKKPLLESFTINGIPRDSNPIEWFINHPKFSDVMHSKMEELRDLYYNATKEL